MNNFWEKDMNLITSRRVPELSLDSYLRGNLKDRQNFIDELYTGLKEYGFFILREHFVAQELVDLAYEQAMALFDMNLNAKLELQSTDGKGQRGYTRFGREHAKNNQNPDLKEFWHVGRELPSDHKFKNLYPENIWPEKLLSDFRPVMTKLYEYLEDVSEVVLEALTFSLDVPKNFFEQMTRDGNSILRLINYPPLDETNLLPGSIRAAAHEDINLITLLVGSTASGLELLDRDGAWLPIQSYKDAIIIDSGDMLSRICNNVIPSTTHRVVNPDDLGESRYSMPFFVHPHPEAMLSCLPSCRGEKALYADINSHDFLQQRLSEIGLGGGQA